MKKTVTIALLLLSAHVALGQDDQLIFYKRLYEIGDSINKKGISGSLAPFIFKTADSLGKEHPAAYLACAAELAGKQQFNEASFLYYLGLLRYRYYNATNPQYKSSEDGALLGSLDYMVGEILRSYLQTGLDNYAAILKASVKYYKANDYVFYPRANSVINYNKQADGLSAVIDTMNMNKSRFTEMWAKERKEMEGYINDALKKK